MNAVLVTGADGYLGARIAALYARSGRPVIAWMRAGSAAEFEAKRDSVAALLGEARYAWGDLRSAEPFSDVPPGDVSQIVHAAAVTRFNIEVDLARQVNVEGTEKLLRFAERCRALEAFGLLSSVYASGLRAGVIAEQPCDGAGGFANHYERSKWQAERLLAGGFDHLPWQVFRIATVIADDESGHAARHNALHNTLKLLYHGLISLVPGNPDTPLYFVSADFAAGNVVELMQRRAQRVIYHLAPGLAQSVTLGELLQAAWQAFEAAPEFRRRRLLPPVYAGLAQFAQLAEGVSGFAGRVLGQAVGSITPFAPQLYVRKSVENANLRAAATAWPPVESRQLVENTCAQLVAAGFGSVPC
jgi:nucleoside-diphosphate-sugar epimerase